MVKEFSSIMELKAIREQKSRLSEREQELASPMLKDYSLIAEVYTCGSRKYCRSRHALPILRALPSGRNSFLSYYSFSHQAY